MDSKFNAAIKALAQAQLEQSVRCVFLVVQEPAGEIVVSVSKKGSAPVIYARIERSTGDLVRLRP